MSWLRNFGEWCRNIWVAVSTLMSGLWVTARTMLMTYRRKTFTEVYEYPDGHIEEYRGEVEGKGTIPPGGTLILMTDGILESSSPAGEMFGEERVLDVVRVNHHKSAAGLVDQLQSAIRAFCSGEAGQDDITFLIVRRSPLAAPRARAASRPRAR